jgi:hypothetical protein
VRAPTLGRLRAHLLGGATATSFPRAGRLAVALAVCAVPAYFALRLAYNAAGPAAMACLLGLTLFGAPAAIVLPALRHDPEHAGREEIARRRLERALRSDADADAGGTGDQPPRSTWESRPAPPSRW